MKNFLFVCLSFLSLGVLAQNVSFNLNTDEGCYPLSIATNNTSNPEDMTEKYYVWELYNQNREMISQVSSQDYNFELNDAGFYTLKLILRDNVGNEHGSYERSIYVDGITEINVNPGLSICPNQEVMLSVYGVSYNILWDFGNGLTDNNNMWTNTSYADTGSYLIKLIVETNCGTDTLEKQIEVRNNVVPNPVIKANDNRVCPNDDLRFYTDNNNWVSYAWDFGNGTTATQKTLYNSWDNIGNYQVVLTVSNECGIYNSDTINIDVANDIYPHANFWENNDSYCPNSEVQLYTSTSGSQKWYFGDGNELISNKHEISYSYPDTGTYIISYVVSNSCGYQDSTGQEIKVKYINWQKPDASMYFRSDDDKDKDTVIICTTEEVSFYTNYWSNYGLTTSSVLDFGDGTSSMNVNSDIEHSFNQAGNYTVKYYVNNGCGVSDTIKKVVIVSNEAYPTNKIEIIPQEVCIGDNVFFVDNNFYDNNNIFYYSLWFGDGDSIKDMIGIEDSMFGILKRHKYTTDGMNLVKIEVTNVCGQTKEITDTVWVKNTGVESFYYIENSTMSNGNYDNSKCPGDNVGFVALGGTSRVWYFEDGTTSTSDISTKQYETVGEYNEYVVLTDGCGQIDTVYSTVKITNNNRASSWLDVSKQSFCLGETISFRYDGSEDEEDRDIYDDNAYAYLWDFGDGNTSTGIIKNYTYQQAGEFTIKLYITNNCGTTTTTYDVKVLSPDVMFSVEDVIVLKDDTAVFINKSLDAINFVWNFGDGNTSSLFQPKHKYNNIGEYTVSLKAQNYKECFYTYTYPEKIKIFELTEPKIALNEIDNVTCFGAKDGLIDVKIEGGVPPLKYQWSNGDTTNAIYNLNKGIYVLTITDAFEQVNTASFTIIEPLELEVVFNTKTPSCYGYNDGKIKANVNGGTSPYFYKWSNNVEIDSIVNVNAGEYTITVVDKKGCMLIDTVSVGQPDIMIINGVVKNATCQTSDGKINININGGSGNFSYLWSSTPAQTTDSLYNVSAGYYTITVTDESSNNCYKTKQFFVGNIDAPSIDSIVYSHISCYGANDGKAQIYVSGGTVTNEYTYKWSHNENINVDIVQNLLPANYWVTVSDDNSCIDIVSFSIIQPEELKVSLNLTNPISCYNTCDAIIIANITGGTGDIEYLWNDISGNSQNSAISDLCAGTYKVTVIDENNCNHTDSLTINAPDTIYITSVLQNIYEDSINGSITINVHNAKDPYSYQWTSNVSPFASQDTNHIEIEKAGQYNVIVTDANGCTAKDSFNILLITNIIDLKKYVELFKIYPIPAKDVINIIYKPKDKNQSVNIQISDIVGRSIITQNNVDFKNNIITLNTNSLNTGVYIIKLQTNNDIITKQIVINK